MARLGPSVEGATAVEYAIVASLIAAVIVAVVLAVGQKTDKMFCDTNDAWADVPNADPARCP